MKNVSPQSQQGLRRIPVSAKKFSVSPGTETHSSADVTVTCFASPLRLLRLASHASRRFARVSCPPSSRRHILPGVMPETVTCFSSPVSHAKVSRFSCVSIPCLGVPALLASQRCVSVLPSPASQRCRLLRLSAACGACVSVVDVRLLRLSLCFPSVSTVVPSSAPTSKPRGALIFFPSPLRSPSPPPVVQTQPSAQS